MPDKLLNLKLDIVFQELFGNPKNSKITGHLLSLILGREVYNVDLDANKRLYGNSEKSKMGRLDVRVKFNDGEDCNIELQVAEYEHMDQRMLEYWAVMYQSKILRGQDYKVLKPSISILITDYHLKQTEDISYYHTIWNLREKTHLHTKLTDDIEMHILEIPKLTNVDIQKEELAQWLKFIDNPDSKEVENFMSENKFLKQAKEELAYLSGDENFKFLVEDRTRFLMDQAAREQKSFSDGKAAGLAEGKAEGLAEGKAAGLVEGKAEGLSEGKKKKQLEIAKKMKSKNISIDEIIELTELSKDEIEKL